MSKQPEALRLADELEVSPFYNRNGTFVCWQGEAAAELRRLHAVNADLLEALKVAMGHIEMSKLKISHCKDEAMIRAALSRAEGASHE